MQFLVEQAKILSQQAADQGDPQKPPTRTAQQDALPVMCQMLLGSNKFLYVE